MNIRILAYVTTETSTSEGRGGVGLRNSSTGCHSSFPGTHWAEYQRGLFYFLSRIVLELVGHRTPVYGAGLTFGGGPRELPLPSLTES